jgi:hypothetical protein
MTDYATLNERLTGRCLERRKVANNTYAERRWPDIAIRLHDTDVVTLHPDGSITLNTGGWYTVTTKDRLNSYLPFGVWDADWCPDVAEGRPCSHDENGTDPATGRWHHGTHHGPKGRVFSVRGEWHVQWFGKDYVYRDGIRLFPDGTVTGAPSETDTERERKRVAWRRRQIKDYLARLTANDIVYAYQHRQGDPWCCSMRAEDGTHPMGENCIGDHVQHFNYNWSLFARAVLDRHYGNPGVVLGMMLAEAERGQVSDLLVRDLRKFFNKKLIEGRATR